MVVPVLSGRTPGAIGISSLTGLTMGLFLGGRILGNLWTKTARRAALEIEKDILKLALRRAGSRLTGKLLTGSLAWKKAFVHIAEHFSLKALSGKPTHTVFVAAYRSTQALEPLIVKTAKGYSKKYISRDLIQGGRPVIVLERVFEEIIGETFVQEMKGGVLTVVKKELGDCRILRVIVDYTGKPITAYPVQALGAVL